MLVNPAVARFTQHTQTPASQKLAASITRASSKQSYYVTRYLVDRELVPAAYQAYAYFRWVDDRLDLDFSDRSERLPFVHRQCSLLGHCLRGDWPTDVSVEEQMLVSLLQNDEHANSGLKSYLRYMMAVMEFDARRRNTIISQEELNRYTFNLAMAVTDALHYFIGNGCYSPLVENRHLAAAGAHIAHMLRDTLEDIENGYFNIPREVLEQYKITPWDVSSPPYREWVKSRVNLARANFAAGRVYLSQVENFRCRIAGYTYIGRFEPILDAIEADEHHLRSEYSECKSLETGLKMCLSALTQSLNPQPARTSPLARMVEES
jgi:phytoene/squalene synthetase